MLSLSLAHLRRFVFALVAGTSGAMIAAGILRFGLGHDSLMGFAQKVNPFVEGSVHTWVGSGMLLLCAVLLLLIALDKGRTGGTYVRHWFVLGMGFLFLSVDETASIHEMVGTRFRGVAEGGMPAHFWALFAAPVGIAILVAYRGFLAHLPSDFRRRFYLSAAIYLGGALGMEALSGLIILAWHPVTIHMYSLATVEETLEMAGAGYFLCVIAQYVATAEAEIGLRLHRPEQEAA